MATQRFLLGVAVLGLVAGCLNVRTPDVRINPGPRPEPIDARDVPETRSHKEARRELAKAYQEIRYLQDQVRDLEKDRDKYKRKYKRGKDKNDD